MELNKYYTFTFDFKLFKIKFIDKYIKLAKTVNMALILLADKYHTFSI